MHTVRSTSRLRLAALFLAVLPVAAPAITLGASPAPEGSIRYVPDRVLVRFRGLVSETDLEIFRGRQFLTVVEYIQGDYPPGLGWYVFRIDDGMDARLVRDLLREDTVVCNAELVAVGVRNAIGVPKADEAPPCEELAAQATPPSGDDATVGAAGAEPPLGTPSSTSAADGQAGALGLPIIVIGSVFVAVLASWVGLRARRRT